MPFYKRWVDIGCSKFPDARNCFTARDAALSTVLGPRKDLLFPNPVTKQVEFLSGSRYTRLLMLTCSQTKLECKVASGAPSGAAKSMWGECKRFFIIYCLFM
jgi:hypothetical protein